MWMSWYDDFHDIMNVNLKSTFKSTYSHGSVRLIYMCTASNIEQAIKKIRKAGILHLPDPLSTPFFCVGEKCILHKRKQQKCRERHHVVIRY